MANGEIVYKTINQREQKEEFNPATNQMEKKWVMSPKKVVDYYKPNDPELYMIKIVDHVALYTPEKGMDLRQTIGKASSQDNVILRNIYGFTNVDIQQQAAKYKIHWQ